MYKIILIGYMGSGKSTIGKLLSQMTSIPTFDLDQIIEEATQKTIPELFSEFGEIKFRKLEHEKLKSFIAENDNYILSLGGGAPCYANNHEFLKLEGITSVYLKASIKELLMRLENERYNRPLLAGLKDEEVEEFVAKHLFDRSYFYHQAKHVVSVDGKNPEAIADEIIRLLA
jgi:shikimate kinase